MNIIEKSKSFSVIDDEMSVNYIKPEYLNLNYHHSRSNVYIYNEKIKFYEDENHEFKRITFYSDKDFVYFKETLSKYICAYLNTNPGILYIGINDEGTIVGTVLCSNDLIKLQSTLDELINSFDSHVKENNLVQSSVRKVFVGNDELIDTYIIEIFVKQGRKDFVYLTHNDECYIKMNGTLRNLKLGNDLFRYIKHKIKKYYDKTEKNTNNFIKND